MVFIARPVLRSHTLTLFSSAAEIKYVPEGWKTRARIQLSWPINVRRHCPQVSQILIVLSLDPADHELTRRRRIVRTSDNAAQFSYRNVRQRWRKYCTFNNVVMTPQLGVWVQEWSDEIRKQGNLVYPSEK